MSIKDILLSAFNENPIHTINVGMKIMKNIDPLRAALAAAKISEEDLLGFLPKDMQAKAQGPVVTPASSALPVKGFMRDHDGKNYSIEDITKIIESSRAQAASMQASQQPSTPTHPLAPRSCLGCVNALAAGMDQPGMAGSCRDKNCKTSPQRPNYIPAS